MSRITTHVLDLSRGCPAAAVEVCLEWRAGDQWTEISRGVTDGDGRLADLGPDTLDAGVYRLVFLTGAYFERSAIEHFHPRVEISFEVRDSTRHYHVPLLVSPFGYSTYRGS